MVLIKTKAGMFLTLGEISESKVAKIFLLVAEFHLLVAKSENKVAEFHLFGAKSENKGSKIYSRVKMFHLLVAMFYSTRWIIITQAIIILKMV